MSVGKSVLRIRQDKGLTQRAVSEASDLTISYISRIENDHVQPTMGTLSRLAEALGVPVSGIFLIGEHARSLVHKCPVSASGQCIGEQVRSRRGRAPKGSKTPYTEKELRLLRMADFLALRGSQEIRQTLGVMLEALVLRASKEMRLNARDILR